jgi:benzoyl-CoA 2,3-dioxygenase component A
MDGMQQSEGATVRQHLIDPEICIRCNTCEATCPIGAITHDENNYVVDAGTCNHCMDCVAPCPTGAIDNWFQVPQPFSLDDQFSWQELPPRPPEAPVSDAAEPVDDEAAALLAEAQRAPAARRARRPARPSPKVNLFNRAAPCAGARHRQHPRHQVRHRVPTCITSSSISALRPSRCWKGQSIGVVPPGTDANGRPHAMRLYSISSARDGEKPGANNLALTIKRVAEPRADGSVFRGVASNWLCDLQVGDTVPVIGPFGATFLLPDDADADIVMFCTGTGSAPFRGFTERRRRLGVEGRGLLHLFFGARTPEELPYFGPLQKVPAGVLRQELVFSRIPGQPKEYVQDRLRERAAEMAAILARPKTHVYVCGLKGLEDGVDAALAGIGATHGFDWPSLRAEMREQGRWHVETY